MGKHIVSYKSFLVLENDNSLTTDNTIALLDKKVREVVSSDMDAIEATEEIKYFIKENMGDLKEKMGDPAFIKSFYNVLEKWYDKYHEKLDMQEINYVSDTGAIDSEFDKDIPTDDSESELEDFESSEDDWEIDF
jgi:hypothetical protein